MALQAAETYVLRSGPITELYYWMTNTKWAEPSQNTVLGDTTSNGCHPFSRRKSRPHGHFQPVWKLILTADFR